MASARRNPTISEMVEALCLFDEPMMNSRYHGMLLRRGHDTDDAELARLPALVLESARLAREGAAAWGAKDVPVSQTDFIAWAESTILESFLTLTENQLRILSRIARSAPTAQSREPFDQMAAKHRHIAEVLRTALKRRPRAAGRSAVGLRGAQEEEEAGDFRGQIEDAIQAAEGKQGGVRGIVLSPTGLRHLRDQGCFLGGRRTLRGHPVSVDLGWDAPAFVIETHDRVSLEEIMGS